MKETGIATTPDVTEGSVQAVTGMGGVGEPATHSAVDVLEIVTAGASDPFLFQFSTFIMACLIGYFVVQSAKADSKRLLPLACAVLSPIMIVCAVLIVGSQSAGAAATAFGFVALVLAVATVFGGFAATRRLIANPDEDEL